MNNSKKLIDDYKKTGGQNNAGGSSTKRVRVVNNGKCGEKFTVFAKLAQFQDDKVC